VEEILRGLSVETKRSLFKKLPVSTWSVVCVGMGVGNRNFYFYELPLQKLPLAFYHNCGFLFETLTRLRSEKLETPRDISSSL
jgi:hypothetical protein